jgi:hypothetical protein
MKEITVNSNNYSKLTRKDNIFLKFNKKVNISRPIYKNENNFIVFKFN